MRGVIITKPDGTKQSFAGSNVSVRFDRMASKRWMVRVETGIKNTRPVYLYGVTPMDSNVAGEKRFVCRSVANDRDMNGSILHIFGI